MRRVGKIENNIKPEGVELKEERVVKWIAKTYLIEGTDRREENNCSRCWSHMVSKRCSSTIQVRNIRKKNFMIGTLLSRPDCKRGEQVHPTDLQSDTIT